MLLSEGGNLMTEWPTKLKILGALWIALAVLNVLAANPGGVLVAALAFYWLWRGDAEAKFWMEFEVLPMLLMGALTLGSTGAVAVGMFGGQLVGGTIFLSIVGLLTLVVGAYTLWVLSSEETSAFFNQRYIARLEAKVDSLAT